MNPVERLDRDIQGTAPPGADPLTEELVMPVRLTMILLAATMMLMFAMTVAIGAAYLTRRDGSGYRAAIKSGAVGFAATLTTATAVVAALAAVAR